MPKLLKFSNRLGLFALAGLLLAACNETASTPTVGSPSVAPTTVATTVATTANNSTSTVVAVATVTPGSVATATATTAAATPTSAAATTPAQGEAAVRDKVTAALKNFESNAKSYKFTVTQNAEITSGGAKTSIEASGTGSFASTNFSQTLTLKFGDQGQGIEQFFAGSTGYQRINNLGVWRKLDPTLGAPTPPATLPNGATGFQTSVPKQGQTLLRYTFPAGLLFTQKGVSGPETLGLLSSTNIFQPFIATPGTGQAEIQLTVNDTNGLLIRREVNFTLNGSGGAVTYKAIYDYSDLNTTGISVTPPPNLPK